MIVAILFFAGGLSAQGNSEDAFQRVKEVQERHTEKLMARQGVVGTAVGLDEHGNHTVLVLLEHGNIGGIPAKLDGVKVIKRVTGKITAREDTARYDRPVPIGVSTGHPAITAGTIGCRVAKDGKVYALSNNHVYADENEAAIGDPVIQPGTYDGGLSPTDDIGTLADFEPIDFSGGTNIMDAAIALCSTDTLGCATPGDGYGAPSSTVVEPELRMRVMKRGRTTGLTSGRIVGINATVDVGYSNGVARFEDQVVISPGSFSAGGDSGSLIVTKTGNNPVALLFAGSFFDTIASPIGPILDRFGVTIDDGSGQPQNQAPTVSILSPSNGATFKSRESISFAGSASDPEDGDITKYLTWTSNLDGQIGTGGGFDAALSDGTHTITASATDSGGQSVSDSISITVGTPPAGPTTVGVVAITYATEGGRNQDRHLVITMSVEDDLGSPVGGAVVSANVFHEDSLYASLSGTTVSDGTVVFKLANAPSGYYKTAITDVVASGLTWDEKPVNAEYTKQ